jgi:hypothetical protein
MQLFNKAKVLVETSRANRYKGNYYIKVLPLGFYEPL